MIHMQLFFNLDAINYVSVKTGLFSVMMHIDYSIDFPLWPLIYIKGFLLIVKALANRSITEFVFI